MSEAEQVDEDGFIGPKNNCYEVVCKIMPTSLTDNKDNACGINKTIKTQRLSSDYPPESF